MNKKSRLLLPTIGLVVLSGIAATSTTFAWFTTVRSAQVDFAKAKVVSTDSSLIIEHAHSFNSNRMIDDDDEGEALVITETSVDDLTTVSYDGEAKITDISGNGLAFYKPIWAVPGVTASAIPAVPLAAVGNADGKLIDFTIKISRTPGDDVEGINVYLGTNTKITPFTTGKDEDIKAVAGARMAVNKSSAAGTIDSNLFVHSPVQETVNPNRYLGADAAGTAYGVGNPAATTGVAFKTDIDVKHAPFATAATNTAAVATGYPALAYLAGSEVGSSGTKVESAYINFRLWVEGEDDDTKNAMISGEFKVTLDLYALAYNAG